MIKKNLLSFDDSNHVTWRLPNKWHFNVAVITDQIKDKNGSTCNRHLVLPSNHLTTHIRILSRLHDVVWVAIWLLITQSRELLSFSTIDAYSIFLDAWRMVGWEGRHINCLWLKNFFQLITTIISYRDFD